MAVELAKVSLWLHTFTTGAPLSFLDHHLRCGDSLYGEWLDDVVAAMEQTIGPVYLDSVRAGLGSAAKSMEEIVRISDDDIAEVRHSRQFFEQAEEFLEPLRHLLDLWLARRWLRESSGGEHPGLAPLLRAETGDLLAVLEAGGPLKNASASASAVAAVTALLARCREVAERELFLHWQVAFPTVWERIGERGRRGGFHAVIGNPPVISS